MSLNVICKKSLSFEGFFSWLYKGEQKVHQSITSETGQGSFLRTAGGCIPVGACAFGAEGLMALCCCTGQRLRRCRSGGKGLGRRLQKEGAPVWIKPLQPGFARGKQANRPSGVGNAPLLPPQAAEGVHFRRAPARLACFSTPARTAAWFYHKRRLTRMKWRPPPPRQRRGHIYSSPAGRYNNPQPEGLSNLRTLRTFGPKARQPSRRRRVHEGLRFFILFHSLPMCGTMYRA